MSAHLHDFSPSFREQFKLTFPILKTDNWWLTKKKIQMVWKINTSFSILMSPVSNRTTLNNWWEITAQLSSREVKNTEEEKMLHVSEHSSVI